MSERHAGVSELRKMTKAVLSDQKDVVVIHDHAQPIAVLIPYQMFMAVQALRQKLEKP